nr:MAG: colicin V production protein [Chloroflexota bacterium]
MRVMQDVLSHMNAVDIAIVAITLLSGALGIYWGVIRQVLSIAGVLTGAVVAGRYSSLVAEPLMSFVTDAGLARGLGFALTFLAVSGLASLAASLLHHYAGLLFLRRLDHLLGGLLGALQGLLTCTVLMIGAAAFPYAGWSPALGASRFAPAVAALLGALVLRLLPESYHFAAQTMLGLP